MNNFVLNFFVDDGVDMNAVMNVADNLGRPLPMLQIENREERVRNANYFETVVPNYTDIQFYEHFRMSRGTADVSSYYYSECLWQLKCVNLLC